MQQEALNTETHTRLWSSSNLRHKSVKFVSAGELERSEFEDTGLDDPGEPGQTETAAEATKPEIEVMPVPSNDTLAGIFFFDSTGQQTIDTGLPNPTPRSEPSVSGDSSEDEVVFMGRRNNQKPIVIKTDNNELQEILYTASENHSPPVTLDVNNTPTYSDVLPEPSQSPTASDVRQRRGSHEEVNDPLADYIANMDRHYHTEDDADSFVHIEAEGGIGVGHAPADPGSSDLSTINREAKLARVRAKDDDEAQFQSSIDGESPDDRSDRALRVFLMQRQQCYLECTSIRNRKQP